MQRYQSYGDNSFEPEESLPADDLSSAPTEEFYSPPPAHHLPPLPPRLAPRSQPSHYEPPLTDGAQEPDGITGEFLERRAPEHTLTFGIKKCNQFLGWLLGVIEVMFALRLVMKLLGASKDNPFIHVLYGLTDPLLAPFTTAIGGDQSVIEWYTLLAMLVYFLGILALKRLLELFITKPEL